MHYCSTSHHLTHFERGARLSTRSTLPCGTVQYGTVSVMVTYYRTSQPLIRSSALVPTISSSSLHPSLGSAKYDGLAVCLLYLSTVPPHTPAESTNYDKCHTIGLTSSHYSPIHPSIYSSTPHLITAKKPSTLASPTTASTHGDCRKGCRKLRPQSKLTS